MKPSRFVMGALLALWAPSMALAAPTTPASPPRPAQAAAAHPVIPGPAAKIPLGAKVADGVEHVIPNGRTKDTPPINANFTPAGQRFWNDALPKAILKYQKDQGKLPATATTADAIRSFGRRRFVSDGTFPISMRGAYAQAQEALYGDPYFVVNARELTLLCKYLGKSAPAIARSGNTAGFEDFATGLRKTYPNSKEVKAALDTVESAIKAFKAKS